MTDKLPAPCEHCNATGIFHVEAKPTISTMKVVGLVHKTKVEAETALKADKSCVTL